MIASEVRKKEPASETLPVKCINEKRLPFGGRFLYAEHIINGRCAGERPVSRFDPGCSAL